MFNRLNWYNDKVVLDQLIFRFQDELGCESGDNCFIFRKTKELINQYETFWQSKPEFHAKYIIELGIFDGGSIAFWFEYFHPKKHVAVDIKNREDSKYFLDYVQSNKLEQKIKTYWKTNQADKTKLREILNSEFDTPIDLVIDDASHMYELTKSSFHILFPHLRPGGLYIIEDWAWAHWAEFQKESHPWSKETALTKLIVELVEATGTSTTLIKSLAIYQGFTVIEKAEVKEEELQEFNIDEWISKKPEISAYRKILNKFT